MKKERKQSRFMFYLLVLLAILYIGSLIHISNNPPPISDRSILILGIDDWDNTDLNLYCRIQNKEIHFVAFPRDGLANIPHHGYWIFNIVQNFKGARFMARYYKQEFDLKVDNTWVMALSNTRRLAKTFKNTAVIKDRARDYEYDEAWFRNRTDVGYECSRGLRDMAYIDNLVQWSRRLPIPRPIENYVTALIKTNSVLCDLTQYELVQFRAALNNYKIHYHLYPGYYADCDFRYSWLTNKRMMYIFTKTNESYLFSTNTEVGSFKYSKNDWIGVTNRLYWPKLSHTVIGPFYKFTWWTTNEPYNRFDIFKNNR